jgi:acetyl esterase/lipase
MRRPILLGLAAAALTLIASAVVVTWGSDMKFYVNLARTWWMGRNFYDDYERLTRDIVFDPAKTVRLDVYAPTSEGDHPVLFFVHGGSWKDYDKKLFAPVAMKLLPEGMVVVIPDYTLHPDAQYEQMADEVAAALSWTLDNIDQYGGDPARVVVAGHSAGAHLGALAVMDPRFLEAYGHSGDEVCSLIGMSGVYDVQAEYDYWMEKGEEPEVMLEVMGGTGNFAQASPLRYVRAGLPPVLLIHGELDETVPAQISVAFDQALRAAGTQSALRLYPMAGHSDYLFAALVDDDAPVLVDIVEFVDACSP